MNPQMPKTLKNKPKVRNFVKSGHTDSFTLLAAEKKIGKFSLFCCQSHRMSQKFFYPSGKKLFFPKSVAISIFNSDFSLVYLLLKYLNYYDTSFEFIFVVKLYLFFSCSDSRLHMLPFSISQTNTFRFIHLLLCVHVIMHVYNAL